MLKRLDLWIEGKIKNTLHRSRDKITKNTISLFKEKHSDVDPAEFIKMIECESDRVYAIVDRSILRERIRRSKVTFWVTASVGVLIVGSMGAFTGGTALPFIAPLVTAVVGWLINVVSIPISYNQRVKGAMDSVLINYEKILQDRLKPVVTESSTIKIEEALSKLRVLSDSLTEQQRIEMTKIFASCLNVPSNLSEDKELTEVYSIKASIN